MQFMIRKIDKQNGHLKNALDVDLNITYLQNVQIHQKIMRNGESKYFLMKKVIVHATTAKITVTKGYMHLWKKCMAMTNVLVKCMATVSN